MKKPLRQFVLFACIASVTALGGSQMVYADDTATTATAPPPAQGGDLGHHRHHRGGDPLRRLAKKLGFSDQQKSQLKAIRTNNHAQAKPLFVALLTAKHGMQTLIQSGSADTAAINAQAALVAGAEANLDVLRAQEFTQFLALLTPDQLTAYKTIQADRQARFQKFLTRLSAGSQQ